MSFTWGNRPKVGEVSRCKRCRIVYVCAACPCGGVDCGAVMWPAGHEKSGMSVEAAAQLVVDRVREFCPNCWTPEEAHALALRETAERKGTAGN